MGFWGCHMFENDRDQDNLANILVKHFGFPYICAPDSIPAALGGLRPAEATPEGVIAVREKLNKDGAFSTKFAGIYAQIGGPQTIYDSRAKLIVFGAIAIEFGVTISNDERKYLNDSLKYRLGMYSEAKFDMLQALERYENGKPLILYGLGSDMYPRKPDGSGFNYRMGGLMLNFLDPSFMGTEFEHVFNECGNRKCRNTGNLKVCSKCRLARFCDRDCQRAAWSHHKAICRARDLPPASPATSTE